MDRADFILFVSSYTNKRTSGVSAEDAIKDLSHTDLVQLTSNGLDYLLQKDPDSATTRILVSLLLEQDALVLKKLETFRTTQALIISSYVYSIVTEIAGDVDTTPVVVSGNSTVQ